MKPKLFFAISLLFTLIGCSSEETATSSQVAPQQDSSPNATNSNNKSVDLINPEPLLALSQVGNVNDTPQFIQSRKISRSFPDGQLHRELTIHFYRNGPNRFHGPFKEWYPNGLLWKEGLYEENNRVGEWKWYAENGELVKHAFYDKTGRPNGTWVYYHDDGAKRRVENYKDGLRHGETTYYSDDGIQLLEKFSFKNDKLDGEFIRWYPREESETEPRKRNQSYYLAGKRHGSATEWYEDGQVRNQVDFKNGERHGRTRRWDAEGTLELDLLFEEGEPVDPTTVTKENVDVVDPSIGTENQPSETPPSDVIESTGTEP